MSCKLIAALLVCSAAQASPLPWDMDYNAVLRDHPAAADEGWRDWLAKYPRRPIHQLLEQWAGPPIEASLLIEQPGPHTADPLATWIYITRDGAQWCGFDTRSLSLKQHYCNPIERDVAQEVIRDVMAMPDPPPPVRNAQDYRAFYFGFVSLYIDGKSLQRPLKNQEWMGDGKSLTGPGGKPLLSAVMQRAVKAGEDFARRHSAEQSD